MDEVISRQGEGVLTILLNRPAKRNAVTSAMYDAIATLLQSAEADESIGCVLIGGNGGTFTGGNDLLDFLQAPPSSDDAAVMAFLRAISGFPKPLGAAVEGVAVGIGVTLLFHCDFVVASHSARFSTPFVSLGLVPEAGSTWLAPRQIGQKATNRLFLLGETLDAAEALEIGLISHVVDGDPLVRAQEAARHLAAQSPRAVIETKRLLRGASAEPVARHIAEETAIFAELIGSDHCRALFQRFLDR